MKYVPNLLSLSRLPLSAVLFFFAVRQWWLLATIVFMVALATDVLDGYVARKYRVESRLGGDVLEPLCDLVLSASAVAGLYFGGVIPLWAPVSLLVLAGLLRLSHATPWKRLRRHTYYLHPLFFLAVVFFLGTTYIDVSFGSLAYVISLAYGITWSVVGYGKRDRLMTWLAGPPDLR